MKQEHPYLLCIKDWIFSTIFSNFKFIPLIFCYTIYIYIYISESILKSLKHRRCKMGAAPTLDSWQHSDAPLTRWFAFFFFRFTPTRADSSRFRPKFTETGQYRPKSAESPFLDLIQLAQSKPTFQILFQIYTKIPKNVL